MEYRICDVIVERKFDTIMFSTDVLLPPDMLKLESQCFESISQLGYDMITTERADLEAVRTLVGCIQHGGIQVQILMRPTSVCISGGSVIITGAYWERYLFARLFPRCTMVTSLDELEPACLVKTSATHVPHSKSKTKSVFNMRSWLMDTEELFHVLVKDWSSIQCERVNSIESAEGYLENAENIIIAERDASGLLKKHWCVNRADFAGKDSISFERRKPGYDLTTEQAGRLQNQRQIRYYSIMRLNQETILRGHVMKTLRQNVHSRHVTGKRVATLDHILVEWLALTKGLRRGSFYILAVELFKGRYLVAEVKKSHVALHVIPDLKADSDDVIDVSQDFKLAQTWSYTTPNGNDTLITDADADMLQELARSTNGADPFEYQGVEYIISRSMDGSILLQTTSEVETATTVVKKTHSSALFNYARTITEVMRVPVDTHMLTDSDIMQCIETRVRMVCRWLKPSELWTYTLDCYCEGDTMRMRLSGYMEDIDNRRDSSLELSVSRRLDIIGVEKNHHAGPRVIVCLCSELGISPIYHAMGGSFDNIELNDGDITFQIPNLQQLAVKSDRVEFKQQGTGYDIVFKSI